MGINKYNSEGYHDPTVHGALTEIDREEKQKAYRPLVFICSPFAGDVENNLKNARRYSRFAVSNGAIPFAPHLLYPQFLDDRDKAQRSLGIFFGLVLLGKCDQMWVFGSEISKGMRLEIDKARKRGIPIRFWSDDCREVRSIDGYR